MDYNNLSLREASLEDALFLFNLRNEAEVRRASFSTDPISLEDHRKWFENKLNNSGAIIFIAEVDLKPVGQVRFDLMNKEDAEVSIAVAFDFRGRGYGAEILKISARKFFNDFPEIQIIHAFIKPDNQASVRSFEKAGYILDKEVFHAGHRCVDLVLHR